MDAAQTTSSSVGGPRRHLLKLFGAGGLLAAGAAAGVLGHSTAAGSTLATEGGTSEGELFPVGGVSTILAVPDADEAVDFYEKAFGTRTLVAARAPNGQTFLAQLMLPGGSAVGVALESAAIGLIAPRSLDHSPVWITQVVPDIAVAIQRASSFGAKVVQQPMQMADVMMRACVQDMYGHTWQTIEVLRPFTVKELEQALEQTLFQS